MAKGALSCKSLTKSSTFERYLAKSLCFCSVVLVIGFCFLSSFCPAEPRPSSSISSICDCDCGSTTIEFESSDLLRLTLTAVAGGVDSGVVVGGVSGDNQNQRNSTISLFTLRSVPFLPSSAVTTSRPPSFSNALAFLDSPRSAETNTKRADDCIPGGFEESRRSRRSVMFMEREKW